MAWLILAAMGGWTLDDLCGTPPRLPWPWPWILRKTVAAAGGVAAFYLGRVFDLPVVDVVSTVALGGAGGVVLTGLVGRFAGTPVIAAA
jgi:hypothetical protein